VAWGLDKKTGSGPRRDWAAGPGGKAGSKGARRIGSANGAGVLRCAQDDGKNGQRQNKQRQNKQQQEQKQIPFGDDNQKDNSKDKQQQDKQRRSRCA
jgi:hypothetical protein